MDILSTLPAANFTLPWMPSLPSIRNMSQIAPLPAIPFLSLITAASLSAADNDHCEVEPMTFDYIIVGAGSAGCVLAARLSENPATTVLLIEAGGDPLPIAGVPGFAPLLQQTEMDWKFLSEPQTKTGQSFTGNRVAYPQGKGLGGTSFLTFNVYHRGNPQDYNDWAAQGNAGWSYNEVLPYFVKSEGTVIPEFVNAPYRGKGGPIKTSWTEKSGIASAFLQASSAAGHPIIADYNNATTPVGVGYGQQTVFAGQRQSTYESYLKPALTRPNLSVWRNKYVKRILVKQNWGQFVANGVQYVPTNNIDCNGYALANKEVIISAGVFQSPKILQLSGIGKPEDLSPFKKIKQLKDLPVGRGLRDHVMLNLPFTYSVPPPDPLNPATPSIADLLKMLVYPPTSTIVDGQLHLKTGVTPTRVQADIQIQLAIVGIQGINLLPTSQHYKQLEAAMTYGAAPTKPLVVFNVIALNTKSKGTVKISSETEALAAPLIDPQLLSDPSDAATLLAGLKKALEIAASSPLNTTFNFKPAEQPVPDCQAYHFLSDDYLRCIIAHRADTGHHPSSTCRMGQSEADSVVDHNLRVHGFTNLRVVDASVFPAPVSGNSNAATIMIAEKIADAIVKAS